MVTARDLLWFDNEGQTYAQPSESVAGVRFEKPSNCGLVDAGETPRVLCTSDTSADYFQLVARHGYAGWYKYRSIRLAPPDGASLSRQAGWDQGPNVLLLSEGANPLATLVELPRSTGPISVHPISLPADGANWRICTAEQRQWPKFILARGGLELLLFFHGWNFRSVSFVIHAKDGSACASGIHFTLPFADESEGRTLTTPDETLSLRWTNDGIVGSMFEKRNRARVETSHQTVRCQRN
jgi:hypothetical protein